MEPLKSLHLFIDYHKANKGGGLINVYYADIETIFDFPLFLVPDGASGFVFNDNIDFLNGHDWHRVPVLPHNKFGWSYNSKKSPQGTIYTVECGGILSHTSTAVVNQLHLMNSKEFVLRVKDRDGQELVLGNPDVPFSFSWDFNGGNDTAQAKTITIKWTAQLREPPMGSPV